MAAGDATLISANSTQNTPDLAIAKLQAQKYLRVSGCKKRGGLSGVFAPAGVLGRDPLHER